jgi:hypothetical protein
VNRRAVGPGLIALALTAIVVAALVALAVALLKANGVLDSAPSPTSTAVR